MSTLKSFGRLPSAKVLGHNSRTSSVVQHSAFFKIPLELRNKIYAYVVVSPNPIHVRANENRQDGQDGRVFFQIRTLDLAWTPSNYWTTFVGLLDISLLSVSEQIHKEAIIVLFERNHFHFDHKDDLRKMTKAFKSLVGNIRSCSLIDSIYDGPLSSLEITRIKEDWAGFSALRKLTIMAIICKTGNDLFEDGVLNNFRPMAFLPLASFDLYILDYDRAVPTAIRRRLSFRAKEILLKDPTLPEEEQVKPSAAYVDSGEEQAPQI